MGEAALAASLLLLLLPGGSAATAPVATGKFVGPGVSAVAYGQGSYPGFQAQFRDGDLVYDSQISVEVVNANPFPIGVSLATEEWTPGTQTVYVNVSQPNGTYRYEPVTLPARLDPAWSNLTLSVLGYSFATASVPLAYASTQRPLELRVGNATWELALLSPVTSSLQGVYTAGGLELVALTEAGATAFVMLAFLVVARRFAKVVRRTPRVTPLWPALWISLPIGFTIFEYVPTNQVLGAISPWLYPAVVGAAVFPYLPRLWRDFDTSEFEGIRPLNLEQATNSKQLVYTTTVKGGLRCAPETWREVLWVLLGHPLPPVKGRTVDLLGKKVEVAPRGMPVSCELGSYYTAEATWTYWYDARVGMTRSRIHLEWWSYETVPVLGPDDMSGIGERKKRRFSPHVVEGYLEGKFPPKRPVAQELAGIRDAETEAFDNEADRLLVAELMGTIRHVEREYAARSLEVYDEAEQSRRQPRTKAEIQRLIERQRKVPHERRESPEPPRTDGPH